MRCMMIVSALAATVCGTATPSLVPVEISPPAHITAAFAHDQFSVVSAMAYGGGVGVSAQSAPNVTINGDPAKRKPAFYISGTAHEMGYLTGLLAAPRVEVRALLGGGCAWSGHSGCQVPFQPLKCMRGREHDGYRTQGDVKFTTTRRRRLHNSVTHIIRLHMLHTHTHTHTHTPHTRTHTRTHTHRP
jgi:hypothetical protein